MTKKLDSYLSERTYQPSQNHKEFSEELKFWESVFKKDRFSKVLEKNKNKKIENHLCGNEFEVKYSTERYQILKTEYESGQWRKDFSFHIHKAEKILFSNYYKDEIAYGIYLFQRNIKNTYEEQVLQDNALIMAGKLRHICGRILIAEMNLCKQEGQLKGRDPAEEYQYYQTHFLDDEEYRSALNRIYPVMHRCVLETIGQYADFISEVFTRLEQDKRQLTEEILDGRAFTKVSQIEGNIADSHRQGRSVLKLRLDNGEYLLYKPHSIENERMFAMLKSELTRSLKISDYNFKMICRQDYGWVEMVHQKDCETTEQVERYFYRLGIHLFLAYLLGTGDLHCENIIASGEYPVLIDLEALVGIQDKRTVTTAEELISEQIANSVLHTGILPFYSWDKSGKGVDISAIGGEEGQEYPVKVLTIVNPGRSDMRMEYKNPVSGESKNLVKQNGKSVDSGAYTKHLLNGFTDTYHVVAGEKAHWDQLLLGVSDCFSRYLISDTQKYAMILNSSYHPDLMMDGADREIYLHSLECEEDKERLVQEMPEAEAEYNQEKTLQSEISDLLQNDIPYFTVKVDEMYLYNSAQEKICRFFHEAPIQRVKEKLKNLSDKELRIQQRFIRISMELVQMHKGKYLNTYCDKSMLGEAAEGGSTVKKMAQRIAEYLADTACITPDTEDINWIGIKVVGDQGRWSISHLKMYLYDGLAGLCVYFHAATKVLQASEYASTVKALDRVLFQYTEECEKDPSKRNSEKTGAYEGEMSVVYTYLILYEIEKEPQYLNYAKRHCLLTIPLLESDTYNDLLEGNSGAIAILIQLYHITQEEQYMDAAKKAANRLCSNAVPMESGMGWVGVSEKTALSGMAHGCSGAAAALSMLYHLRPQFVYKKTIRELLLYEESTYDRKYQNWKDLRDYKKEMKEEETSQAVAWCHGAAGILLSRVMMCGYAKELGLETEINRDIKRGIYQLDNSYLRTGFCLCHGSFGNLWIAREAKRLLDASDTKAEQNVLRTVQLLEKQWEQMLPQEMENPGLMSGMAGIGYFLLKELEPSLPDVLKLEGTFHIE